MTISGHQPLSRAEGELHSGTTSEPAAEAEMDWAACQDKQRLGAERDELQRRCDNLQRLSIGAAGRYSWALAVGTELARCPRGPAGWLLQALPHGLWRWFQMRQLRRKGLFDVKAYRSRYPDTRRSRFGPLAHFLRWGVHDGRVGGPNETRPTAAAYSLEDIRTILDSGLFDVSWYRERYGFVGSDEAVVRHYLQESAADPLINPGPLFSNAFYILEHPDTARVNPLLHYLHAGRGEGRRAFAPAAADAFMAAAHAEPLASLDDLFDRSRRTLVFVWDKGNFFFEDIARYVCEYLADRGITAELRHDNGDIRDGDTLLVVAPHEYCIHGPGADWSEPQFRSAIHVNTEQWHTSWFSLAYGVMARSGRALDINPASARGLSKLGLRAGFLPILPREQGVFSFARAPLTDQTAALRAVRPLTYSEEFSGRPYDVLYVAALNDRRARILANLSPVLSGYNCFLHTPVLSGPVNAGSPNMIGSADCAQLARNSRILLNIHQGESHYFEWHRLFLAGIWEGAVVVSEPCIPTGIVHSGVHYLEMEAGLMGDYLAWLLGSPEGQRTLQAVHCNCLSMRRDIEGGRTMIA